METQDSSLGEPIAWFLDHLKVERGISEHTVAAYRNDLSLAAKFFEEQGVTSWNRLNDGAVSKFESSLGHRYSISTA
ncbi:MAG: site-specific integrase, partial [Fimbriimonadaceae bacterium]|nr:site-specific integrase [Fimbriimonadaceae bacterium]